MRVPILLVAMFFGFQSAAQVLATVGNSKITAEDFDRKLNEIRKEAVNPPSPEQFLEDLVRFNVGVQEAEKMGLQNDPLVKERIKQVLYNALLEKEIGKKVEDIKITEKEMREYYKKNPEIRLAHILIEIKAGAKPEDREAVHKRALEILDDVKKSKRPFEELVRLYTDDLPTKELGGDIGFQSRVTLAPVLYDNGMKMKIGDVRGLLETRYGYHIVKLLDKRSFDLADKRQIRAALFDEKRAQIFNDYFEKMKKHYKIEVNHDALKAAKNH
jgi:peptidyl-prolyl cis-trans isomerase C/peptidyl-prolyl cis-trans isomerase D